jgi:cytochrome c-type biogenesis protein CcmH
MMRLLLILCVLAAPVWAVQPDEVLNDPALEARARALSKDLRCLVCRNESIDESNAELARDLRILVRERLLEGDSDSQVMDYVVARYGEFVLLRPLSGGSNMVLWLTGPAAFFIVLLFAAIYVRRRSSIGSQAAIELSSDEQKRLTEILKD